MEYSEKDRVLLSTFTEDEIRVIIYLVEDLVTSDDLQTRLQIEYTIVKLLLGSTPNAS